MKELTPEMDKVATHTALRLRNNVLATSTWAESVGLDPDLVKDAPTPVTWGRLKYFLTTNESV